MPRRRRHLRKIAVWNMRVGRGRAAIRGLRHLIRDTNADAVLLQEAKNYVVAIRAAFPHWRVYSGVPFRDSANCTIMVRRKIKRGKHGVIRNRVPWIYAGKGRHVEHPGRQWRYVWADGIALISIHKATNVLSLNRDAGREEADNLIDWFDSHSGPMFAAGDWNNRVTDRRPNAPRDIARNVKGELLVPPGARIDFALLCDIEATVKRGKTYGSDHQSAEYTIHR